MNLELNLLSLFEEDWNTSVKVIQKDEEFMFRKNPTKIIGNTNSFMLNVNCLDWTNIPIEQYNTDITNTQEFADDFNSLCQKVIDKGFKMFRNPEASVDNFLNDFIEEQHGSGVCSLFWLFYQIKLNKDVMNIVVDSIDGVLHPLSMQQLCAVLKNLEGYKIILLMNQDILMSNWIMEIENLYVLKKDVIKNIQDCTDKELKVSHNLQKMYRENVFDFE